MDNPNITLNDRLKDSIRKIESAKTGVELAVAFISASSIVRDEDLGLTAVKLWRGIIMDLRYDVVGISGVAKVSQSQKLSTMKKEALIKLRYLKRDLYFSEKFKESQIRGFKSP